MLNKEGKMVILVPAFQWLFNQFDTNLDHQRRYSMQSLSQLFQENGFSVVYQRYFNFIGMLGWFFSGSVLRKKMIPKQQMRGYDTLVPFWKLLDYPLKQTMGNSIIMVAQKKYEN